MSDNTIRMSTIEQTRAYDVVAVRVPIVYDAHGDHERSGEIYTLATHEAELRRVREQFPDPFPDPESQPHLLPQPHPLVRPLVLRARVGERLEVRFRNELRRRAGIHVDGAGYDVTSADGGRIGANPDSSVEPGGSRTYVWDCHSEGTFYFGDIADLRGHEDAANAQGMFGALIVEPVGATWTDPVTGDPLVDGLYADVHVPGEPSFREYTVIMHDETSNDNPLLPKSSAADHMFIVDEHAGGSGSGTSGSGTSGSATSHEASSSDGLMSMPMGDSDSSLAGPDGHATSHSVMLLNYRTEPAGGRFRIYDRMMRAGQLDPERDRIVGEEQHHSSWLFGDPATPVLRAYRGDRAKIRLLHGGVKETHVFHLHVHQWHAVSGNEDSPIIDSVSIGPQQGMTIEPIAGAGSVQRATGDVIFHCHLYPHFHSGMWGMWRIFDVLQDGESRYPDGTPIVALRPLPGHAPPPAPTPARPGWPNYMAGQYPQKSPRPPRTPRMPDGMGREPSELESAAFVDDPQPGEAFTKVTPSTPATLRRYDIIVMEAKLVYFTGRDGTQWYDDRGVFYVLKDEVDAAGGLDEFQRQLETGERAVEPLAIRANKGDVIQLSLTNALPPGSHEATHFDPFLPFQPECGLHVHLVKFDPLVSDGSSVGWNYLSGTTTEDHGKTDYMRYNTWIYRWYCDEEFGTIFFHDHLLANERQRHGLFGCMVAEPEGSQWTTPGGEPVSNASQVVVRSGEETFREQVVAFGDFVPLYRARPGETARPVNPPSFPGDLEDHGAVAVNYRCEPLVERPGDPADWYSSRIHGDPQTPLLRGYPGEPLRVRHYQGSHEEQHSFRISGMRWPRWWSDPTSPPVDQQTIGISEAFTHRILPNHSPGDYQWSFTTNDDLWMGAWGLFRLHDNRQDDLPPIPGAFDAPQPPPFDPAAARRYRVSAVNADLRYSDQRRDPVAARFTVDGEAPSQGPLVLRCRVGEWVEVVLTNALRQPLVASPFDPRLSEFDRPGDRRVSSRVSMHPSGMLRYDVRTSDGSNVGYNADGTARPSDAGTGRWNLSFNTDGTIRDVQSVVYRWYAATPGVVLLEDRADTRTHRHRGLIGALVIEEEDVTPVDDEGNETWSGEQVQLRQGDRLTHELVLLLQDGLRLYHDGDHTQPVRDLADEAADAGQKGFNYRSAHLRPMSPSLNQVPPTPILECAPGDRVRLHLVVAADRARNHAFSVHDQTWPMEDHLDTPRVGTIGALATGSTRSTTFTAGPAGDYAYRSGVLRWHLTEGVWGLIRVR